MALDVLPLLTDSSSTSPTRSGSRTNTSGWPISANDRFSKDLAAAADKSAKASSASARAASAKSGNSSKAPPEAETPPASKSRAGMTRASGKSKSSSDKRADSSDGQSASDTSTSDAAAASKGNSAASGVSNGRAPGRGSAAKGAGSQNATQAASGAAEDPSSDTSNSSGLSLLQLLAQSLEAAPSTDGTTTGASDKATSDNGANPDANAIALAQFTQALAAALTGATAALQPGISNASVADGSEVSVTDVTKGASAQDLVALLAHAIPSGENIAAEGRGKSDADAPQSDVAATRDSPTDTSAAGPNSLAHSGLAQLGVTSHFSLQQPQNASNTGELKSPVGSAAWNDELGAQLTWMTRKGLESGSLRVSPEHLGPVEVQITVQNGDASVWFGASHPDTRAALEQALPRLREMFATQGMTLTDSGVSRESPRNQAKSDSPRSVASVSAVGGADVSVASAVRASLGLVDTYA